MTHFILLYSRATGRLVVYQYARCEDAFSDYCAAERKHADDQDTEVVLLGAESFEDLKKTHGNYFARPDDLLRGLL